MPADATKQSKFIVDTGMTAAAFVSAEACMNKHTPTEAIRAAAYAAFAACCAHAKDGDTHLEGAVNEAVELIRHCCAAATSGEADPAVIRVTVDAMTAEAIAELKLKAGG